MSPWLNRTSLPLFLSAFFRDERWFCTGAGAYFQRRSGADGPVHHEMHEIGPEEPHHGMECFEEDREATRWNVKAYGVQHNSIIINENCIQSSKKLNISPSVLLRFNEEGFDPHNGARGQIPVTPHEWNLVLETWSVTNRCIITQNQAKSFKELFKIHIKTR